MADNFPTQAQVVVIGGGIAGCSVAYHLTKLGWTDVLVLERKKLSSGTTWHAAGLVGQIRASHNLTRLACYGTELYEKLEAETGQATGYTRRGSVAVARTEARMEEFRRQASMAKCFGVEVDVISPGEAGRKWPLMRTDDLVGAIWIPGDGQTNPSDTCAALAKGARMGGATIFENVKVTEVKTKNGAVTGVVTDRGEIACDYAVNCGGIWARDLGEAVGVPVPLHAAEHFYIVTKPMEGLVPMTPTLRDYDGRTYYKEDAGKLLVGGFEETAKPWAMNGIPEDFEFDALPEDWDHFETLLGYALERVPALETAEIRQLFVGPESFTPDNRYMLGEAPQLRNYYVLAGFNSVGIASGAGAGKAVAEWMVAGEPTMDLWDIDIRRVFPFQNNKRYLHDRIVETLGVLYDHHWPFRQPATARGVRRSALHDRLAERGAVFGSVAGWERANWHARDGIEPRYEYAWGRQNWFPAWRAEHMAAREDAALFDLSSFAKFQVEGPEAEAVMQRVSAADMAVAPGRVVYTQWLNRHGGIEADLTVTRLAEDRYMVVTAAATAIKDLDWLRRQAGEARVTVTDISSTLATLSLMGPKSRDLLSAVTDTNLGNEAFPYMSAQPIEVGYGLATALRVTYVGELGWELYVPTEMAAGVFDTLAEAGEAQGLAFAGYHALDSLRSEKGYRHWGHDIGIEDSPIQAGLGFAVAFDKNADFTGRDAVLRQRDEGVTRRLLQFALKNPEPLLYYDEPIRRDGHIVGRTTSGSYGHALGAAVGMGYVENGGAVVTRDWLLGGSYEIEVAGERIPAEASLRPLYDPKSERVRG